MAATMDDKYQAARDFLDQVYPSPPQPHKDKPWITLTYAQSLDGMIAKQGQQLLLSGPESMAMTHRLRLLHDAILVGIGTVLVDNPQLNARHAPAADIETFGQPQPIVLDTRLDMPLDCKLITNYRTGVSNKQPWVVTSKAADASKLQALQEAGAHVIQMEDEGRPDFGKVFKVLRQQYNIERVMVEGGARVIQSCQPYADEIIETTAPVTVGSEGLPASRDQSQQLVNIHQCQFGNDKVFAAQCLR